MGRREIRFPDPRLAGDDGLLCVGGGLDVETLYEAYRNGIFPWPQKGLPILWFSPPLRGILDFDDLHWPRRFLRELKDSRFTISFNQAFDKVIHECSNVPRSHETGTWILAEVIKGYTEFHRAGFAHSVECWKDGELVGGLYGVFVEGVFSGESMFYKANGASKRCLHALTQRLRLNGVNWMDIQMVTPILESFGGKYISRDQFLERLKATHQAPKKVRFE